MAYFVTLLNGTVPFTAFTKYSPHGEEVERKSFLFPTLTQAPPPFPPRTCTQNTNLNIIFSRNIKEKLMMFDGRYVGRIR